MPLAATRQLELARVAPAGCRDLCHFHRGNRDVRNGRAEQPVSGRIRDPEELASTPASQMTVSTFAVVVTGSMNPAIHHPFWYAAGQSITEADAQSAATTAVIVPQFAQFSTARWRVDCIPERWSVTSLVPGSMDEVLGLACTTFRRLGETPVNAFGLNYELTGFLRQRGAPLAFMSGIGLGEYVAKQIVFGRPLAELKVETVGLLRSLNVVLEPRPDAGDLLRSNVHHDIRMEHPGKFDLSTLLQAGHADAMDTVVHLSNILFETAKEG